MEDNLFLIYGLIGRDIMILRTYSRDMCFDLTNESITGQAEEWTSPGKSKQERPLSTQ